jgi:NADPH:quinone reductase-like Zn-dependent oxidoreductase
MKAIVHDEYGEADVLRLDDIPVPTPSDDEVLLRVQAAGVDPGVWHLMTGLPYLARPSIGLRLPKVRTRGRDVAGTVEAVGSNVTQFAVGDEVFGTCEGSFAEFAVATPKHLALAPKTLTPAEAAAIPISGLTALHALRAANVSSGQQVLVIGAGGGIGTYLVQLLKARGAHVTALCSSGKHELVRSLGADDALDYRSVDITDGSRRFDVIIDTAGNRTISALRRALERDGTLVLVGGEDGKGRLFQGFDRQLRGPLISPFVSQTIKAVISGENHDDIDELRRLADDGVLRPVVDRTFALEEAADAVRHVASGHATGKTVVVVNDQGAR